MNDDCNACKSTVRVHMLSLPSVSPAAPLRFLSWRLESLAESDRQMCHQVNLSDSSHSWVHWLSVSSFCRPHYCLFHSCSPFPHFLPSLLLQATPSFHAFHPLLDFLLVSTSHLEAAVKGTVQLMSTQILKWKISRQAVSTCRRFYLGACKIVLRTITYFGLLKYN